MDGVISLYMFMMVNISFLMLSVSGLSCLLELDDGVFQAVAKNITYPLYVLTIFLAWAWIAELYTDSVSLSSFI